MRSSFDKKKKKKGKGHKYNLQQRQLFHSNSTCWSPRKFREAEFRKKVKAQEEKEKLRQKATEKQVAIEKRVLKAQEKEQRRVVAIARAEAAKKKRVEEKEMIDQRKHDREAAKAVQPPSRKKKQVSKTASNRLQKKYAIEQGRGGASGRESGEVVSEKALAPLPKITRNGRKINPPQKLR